MLKNIIKFFKQGYWKKWVLPVFAIVTCITCIQEIQNNNNNFIIFRYSSFHLLAHQPLYTAYPHVYDDYFLYNPSFTVLFMPFAFLPFAVALFAWTCIGTFVFLRSVYMLPGISDTAKNIFLVLVFAELVNNQQYVQTNIFLSAIMLLTFIYFERGKLFWAAFFAVLAFCIKGYGGIAGLLFILYPGRLKFLGYALLCGILFTVLPMLFVSFHETVLYYEDWFKMISSDEIKESISIIGVFGKTHQAEFIITIIGLLLLISSLIIIIRYRNQYYSRALLCCYLFVWVILFNRAAESPTYLIAITGIAFWFVLNGYNRINLYMISFLFFIVYILPSDLFPSTFRQFFREHQLKVYPFIIVFVCMQLQVFYNSFKKTGFYKTPVGV